MFDLTDDVENSPDYTKKVKPAEVKVDYSIPDKPEPKKSPDQPENDQYNEYEYSDKETTYEDDKNW